MTSSLGGFVNNEGVWTLVNEENTWNFDQSTGTLSLSAGPAIFNAWAAENGLSGDDADPTADPDSDQVSNLLEFAFGTDPNSPALQELVIGQDPVEALGSPVLLINEPGFESGSALFSQRKDRDTTGSVSYAWEFSSDLLNWESSADAPSWLTTPTLIAEDASEQYDIAEVSLPATLDNGTIPQFFRVVVTLQE